MTRPGYEFSTRFRVRYAEIDGQKVVFNSRYLEYADHATTEFWEWTGASAALGDVWDKAEFHVRRSEVDYLKPFVWGDEVEVFVRIERLGNSSMVQRFALCHAVTGDLHCEILMTNVHVDLETHRPMPLPDTVRAYLTRFVVAD